MKKNKIFLFSAAALLAIGLTSCATPPEATGTTTTAPTTTSTTEAPAVTITINAAKTTVVKGEKVEFSVKVTNSTEKPTLTVDNPAVGEVVTENGKTFLKGIDAGNVIVIATIGEVSAQKTFTVAPLPVITVTAAAEKIEIGAETKLTIATQHTTEKPTVTTSDEAIATVTKKEDGAYYVKGIAQGEATITATIGKVKGTVKITVNPVLTVSLAAKEAEVIVGQKVKLLPTIENNVDDLALEYSVKDNAIAEVVKEYGHHWILGKKAGQAEITLKVGTKTAKLSVTVNEAPALAIEFYGNDTFELGDEALLNAIVTNNPTNLPTTYTVAPANLGTIETRYNLAGEKETYFVAKTVGEGTITATVGEVTAELPITITKPAVSIKGRVEGSPYVGEEVELFIQVLKNVDNAPITVSSVDPTQATVRSENGHYYVKGLKATSARIKIECAGETSYTYIKFNDATAKDPVKQLKNVLYESIPSEIEHLSTATSTFKDTKADNTKVKDETATYNIYANGKAKSTTVDNVANTTTEVYVEDRETSLAVMEVEGDKLVNFALKEYKEDGNYSSITKADGTNLASSAPVKYSTSANTGTVARTLVNHTVFNQLHTPLATTETNGNTNTFAETGTNTYTYTGTGVNKMYYVEHTSVLTLDANGMLAKVETNIKRFAFADTTAKTGKGALKDTQTLNIELSSAARTNAADKFLDETAYYFTDYTPVIKSDYEQVTEITVGSTFTADVTEFSEATASDKVDAVTIKSVAPAENVALVEGEYLALKDGDLTITTTNKSGVEKTLTLKVNKPSMPSGFTIDGLNDKIGIDNVKDFTLAQEDLYSSITLGYADYEVTLAEGAPEGARIIETGIGTYQIVSPNLGKATIKATSPLYVDENGAPIVVEKEIEFVEKEPVSIDDVLANLPTSMTFKGFEGSYFGLNSWGGAYYISGEVEGKAIDQEITFSSDPETGDLIVTPITEGLEENEFTHIIVKIEFSKNEDGSIDYTTLELTAKGKTTPYITEPAPEW